MRISERIAKLEKTRDMETQMRRTVRHIIRGDDAEQEAQMAAIVAADPDAYHIFRRIVPANHQASE